MTTEELKIIFEDHNKIIRIGFMDLNLLLKVEDLLLKNDYRWKGRDKNWYFLRDEYFFKLENKPFLLYINYDGYYPKILSCDPYSNHHNIEQISDMIVTDSILTQLKLYFNSVPTYKPKKFTREI